MCTNVIICTVFLVSLLSASTREEHRSSLSAETIAAARLFKRVSPARILSAAINSEYSDDAHRRYQGYKLILADLPYRSLLDAAGIALNLSLTKVSPCGEVFPAYLPDYRHGAYSLASLISFADLGIVMPYMKSIDVTDNPQLQTRVYADLIVHVRKFHRKYQREALSFQPAWKRTRGCLSRRERARTCQTKADAARRKEQDTLFGRIAEARDPAVTSERAPEDKHTHGAGALTEKAAAKHTTM